MMAHSGERQNPCRDNDMHQTLAQPVGEHEAETEEPKQSDALRGERGRRKRPQYPSEPKRRGLTLDTDLEPVAAGVLRKIAENSAGLYGEGPIRLGDLGTAALILALLGLNTGEADTEAEWPPKSRGARSASLGERLEEKWRTLVQPLRLTAGATGQQSASGLLPDCPHVARRCADGQFDDRAPRPL